jgi:peptidoglycan/LPS O-acetylase OafA/YrhL
MTGPAVAPGRLGALDGLRGFAALLVMGLHIAACLGWAGLGHGYLMVDLFFLLSGFVLSAGYGQLLAQGGQGRWFAWRRLLRLWPLSLAGLFLGALVAAGLAAGGLRELESQPVLRLVLGAAFLPWLAGGLVCAFNGPAWSLQLELWINVAYGLVARWLTDRRLMILVALAATALAIDALLSGNFDGGFANNDPGRSAGPYAWGMGWLRIGFAFPAGILLHRLWLAGRIRLSAASGAWLVPVALMAIALPPLGLPPLFDLAVVFLAFPVLLIMGAETRLSGAAARISDFLGRISYGLYVLHGPILVLFREIEPAGLPAPLRLAWYGAAALTAILAATVAERIIDRPARHWVARRWAARPWFERGSPERPPGTIPDREPTRRTAAVQLGSA